MGPVKVAEESCPDCGRPLQKVWDYPANELWCVHCGNRYFASFSPTDSDGPDPLVGFRILLLDPGAERRDRLARHFMRLGYQVTPVCHPRQALEAASFRRFDVAVFPATLPEFDSLALVSKLKSLLGTVKFVLLVNKSDPPKTGCNDRDVILATIDVADYQQLEQMVEQLIDEAVAAQSHRRQDSGALVGTA